MPAAFGLIECHKPDPFPLARIIDPDAGISTYQLQRAGLLFDGAIGTIKVGAIRSQARTEGAEVFIGGTRLRTRPAPAPNVRYWVCPLCGADVVRLYCCGDRWGCRKCHGLDYASRHCFRSLPGYHRARWLRRRLQLPQQLFSAIPSYPSRYTRKRRLAAELRLIEASLAKHLQGINDTLARRRAQRKRWPV